MTSLIFKCFHENLLFPGIAHATGYLLEKINDIVYFSNIGDA